MKSKFAREKLTFLQALTQAGYGKTILLPSHPVLDPLFAIGGPERYFPISLRDLIELYRMIGIDFAPVNPLEFASRFSSIYDWTELGLVLQ